MLPTMQETLLINWLIGVKHAYYKFEQPWWEWLSDRLSDRKNGGPTYWVSYWPPDWLSD